ncbi:MAG: NUDIX domain-containing protein [Spirochaetaceae bacterium]|jgi:8-oxo-dGTP pyrophosphatase MutT (NUDIX family)|nr:NUDIX domain-containing protein [Spirochaetaceae bacterium]
MWNYCPSCASPKIQFDGSHRFSCPACGFVYYHNTAAATGCVIRGKRGVLLLSRGKEPARGKLDLPGGFVDPGEGALEGLARELREEIGWTPPSGEGSGPPAFRLFASFPNVYPYRGILYNTCDMFFSLDAPELTEEDLHPQAKEIEGLRFVEPEDILMEDIAFDSTRRALAAYLRLPALQKRRK